MNNTDGNFLFFCKEIQTVNKNTNLHWGLQYMQKMSKWRYKTPNIKFSSQFTSFLYLQVFLQKSINFYRATAVFSVYQGTQYCIWDHLRRHFCVDRKWHSGTGNTPGKRSTAVCSPCSSLENQGHKHHAFAFKTSELHVSIFHMELALKMGTEDLPALKA